MLKIGITGQPGFVGTHLYNTLGYPYYNSVVATFCHQLIHNEQPKIEVDGEIKLIYVGELVAQIIEIIKEVNIEHPDDVVIQELKFSIHQR